MFGTDASYPPNEFTGPDGTTIDGMDIDLGTAVAQKLGLTAEFQNSAFPGIIPGIQGGKYELGMSSFSINPERLQTVDMVSYFTAGTAVGVKSGNPDNINPDDLCGKLFHTTKMPGIGFKTRARVLASGLLDDEYGYENLVSIPGITDTQARNHSGGREGRVTRRWQRGGRDPTGGGFVNPASTGFVKEREPVEPGVLATDFLYFPNANGDARPLLEKMVEGDPRFAWDEKGLATVDPTSLALDEAPYVVFDVETTGASAGKGGAITEIGAVKLVRGQVVDRLSTLVNPGRDLFVVRLTGITDRMVADAPPIDEVMPRFEELVEGSVLVGHNVGFDCAFVAAAREAAGLAPLPNPVLDTLKLARRLVPGLRRYRLGALVEHFGLKQAPNHRALADASATADVFLTLLKLLRSAGVGSVGEAAVLRGGRSGRIKPQKQHLAADVPNTPGVYYFLDKHGTTLYVGKAKDLKARVRTYFNGGDGRRKIGRLVEEVAEVQVTETGSELEALILEAREIRRLLPRYNSAGRGDRTNWYVRLNLNEPFPVPERVSTNAPEEGVIFLGPYGSASTLDVCVEALGRVFPLRRCDGTSARAPAKTPASTGRWAAARRASAWTRSGTAGRS